MTQILLISCNSNRSILYFEKEDEAETKKKCYIHQCYILKKWLNHQNQIKNHSMIDRDMSQKFI